MQFTKQSWLLAALVAAAAAQETTTVTPEGDGAQPSNTADRVSFYSSVDTNIIVSTELNTELQSTSLPASLYVSLPAIARRASAFELSLTCLSQQHRYFGRPAGRDLHLRVGVHNQHPVVLGVRSGVRQLF